MTSNLQSNQLPNTLFQVFASSACDTELKKLFVDVDLEVERSHGGRQTVVVESRGFNKELYFNVDCWRCSNLQCNIFGKNTEEHEKDGCNSRTVPCIIEDCNARILLYLLPEHLVESHGHTIPENPVNIYERGKIGVGKDYEEGEVEYPEEDGMWDPHEVILPFSITRDGRKDETYRNRHSIFPRFVKEGGIYYMYLRVIANDAVADKYCVDLEVTTPGGHATTKISNVRVYGVDVPWHEVKDDGQRRQYRGEDGQYRGGGVLVIPKYMANHYTYRNREEETMFETKFRTHFTIRYPSWP